MGKTSSVISIKEAQELLKSAFKGVRFDFIYESAYNRVIIVISDKSLIDDVLKKAVSILPADYIEVGFSKSHFKGDEC